MEQTCFALLQGRKKAKKEEKLYKFAGETWREISQEIGDAIKKCRSKVQSPWEHASSTNVCHKKTSMGDAAAAGFLCATVALIACAAGQDEELTILELPLPDPREQELLLYRRRLARVNYLRARCDQTALDLPRHPDDGTLFVQIHEFVPANTTVAATVKKIQYCSVQETCCRIRKLGVVYRQHP